MALFGSACTALFVSAVPSLAPDVCSRRISSASCLLLISCCSPIYLFQVMLWVLASLLTLVEYVFSEEDKESQHVSSQPSWSPSEDSNAHPPWHEAAGKQTHPLTHPLPIHRLTYLSTHLSTKLPTYLATDPLSHPPTFDLV